MSQPSISVIIPTFKRKKSVLRLLNSLKEQSIPHHEYEVIVVDDGSPDDTYTIAEETFPFPFSYFKQENQGATVARNFGVEQSVGHVLVFIDDDITVSHQTLARLAESCQAAAKQIAMGTLIQRNDGEDSIYATIQLADDHHIRSDEDFYQDFVFCNTELLAVQRHDFFALGKLQDPTNGRGWPNWDDVDFGYRAHLQGYRLLQVATAVGEHWDYSMGDWHTACRRWKRACQSAVLLFTVHPPLRSCLPMLTDKTPVQWGGDSPKLIARKLIRAFTATGPIVWLLEQSIRGLEKYWPAPAVLRPLYRWVAGGYMYQGYQQGLREYKMIIAAREN